jgi:hypothetical protein
MGTTEDVKKLAEEQLEKQPKSNLVRIIIVSFSIILFLGSVVVAMWRANDLKQKNEIKTQLQEIRAGQVTISKNQVEMHKETVQGFRENKEQHEVIMLDQGELRLKQNVVIKTLPEMSRKTTEQIEMIYKQMRKDQSPKDSKVMDESYLDPISVEVAQEFPALTFVYVDTLKKN